MSIECPRSRVQIVAALAAAESEVASFFGSLPDDELLGREGEAWSPAEHLVHLNLSVGAVCRGMAIHPWLLRLSFGASRRPSRGYAEMRELYRERLAAGGRATGRYVPRRDEAPDREGILSRWERVNARLRGTVETWSERDLDRVLLPHPLLGKLTAREMLFFTAYHALHHVEAARRRLSRFAGAGATG
jgi:hypothetical protein